MAIRTIYLWIYWQHISYSSSENKTVDVRECIPESTVKSTDCLKAIVSQKLKELHELLMEPDRVRRQGYEYMGCYKDDPQRMLDDMIDDSRMTFELCYDKCAKYSHFGLQATRQCFCGNSIGDPTIYPPRPEDECNMACKGNTSQTCGGYWRMSVYRRVLADITSTANKDTTKLPDSTSAYTGLSINSCQCPCADVGHNKWLYLQNANLSTFEIMELMQPELEALQMKIRVQKTNTNRFIRSKKFGSR